MSSTWIYHDKDVLSRKVILPKVFWTNLPFKSLLLAPSHSSYIWSEYDSYLESRSVHCYFKLSFQRRCFWILWSRYCSGQTSSTLYRRFAGRTWACSLVVARVQKVVWGWMKGWDGEDGWRLWLCYPGLRSATGKMMWKGSEEEKTDGKLRSGDGMEEICLQNVEDECSTHFFRWHDKLHSRWQTTWLRFAMK